MKILGAMLVLTLAAVLDACTATKPAPIVERTPGAPPPGPVKPTVRVERPEFYAVRPGDTFTSIAAQHGIDRRELQSLNNLSDANRLLAGQVLRLRAAGSIPPTPPMAVTAPPTSVPPPAEPEIQVNPIVGRGAIETRPLDPTPARPLDLPPVATPPVSAGPSPTPVAPEPATPAPSATVKTEPRPFKLPYSDENLALVRRNDLAVNRPEPRTNVPPPAGSGAGATAGQTPPPGAPAATPAPVPGPATGPTPGAATTPPPAPPPAATAPAPAAPPLPAVSGAPPSVERDGVAWSWPVAGRVMQDFTGNTRGVDLSGKVGDPVLAAASGRVMYAGNAMRGLGNLIIIKHNDNYLSAYAHNSKLLVKEGQSVARGQRIADLGQSDTDRPKLHFEIRRQGRPVDPAGLLPDR